MKITTWDPKKQQNVMVGVFENRIFYKKVLAMHFMKVEQGYGIQEDVIQRLKGLGCEQVIIDTGGKMYDINFGDYTRNPPRDYGNGLQRFVAIKRTSNKPAEQLTLC